MPADAQEGISQMPPLLSVKIPDEEVSPIYEILKEDEEHDTSDTPDDEKE